MSIGAFSISLSVKDIKISKEFYKKLGFSVFGGDIEQNWLILKNGSSVIGLFHGMLENNILTFNPGWDQNAEKLQKFTDIREIQKQLQNDGFKIDNKIDENTSGAASLLIYDPDGNSILIDQHI
jgi:catechol 2,3-dioxygenase-like lactoylglutathione lyase family enzyme